MLLDSPISLALFLLSFLFLNLCLEIFFLPTPLTMLDKVDDSVRQGDVPNSRDFAAVRKDIAKLLHQPDYDDGSAGPVLVRLAWYVFLLQPCLFFGSHYL